MSTQQPGIGRRRLRAALRPRGSRGQVLAALICALLGFALVVQARQTQAQGLAALRQSELVRILDDVTDRSARLQEEAQQLRLTQQQLSSGTDRAQAAAAAAQARLDSYALLAGTVAATGPGIQLTIVDPAAGVRAATLLDTVQELRDAGAEAIEISGTGGRVRVVASTYFLDVAGGGVQVDQQRLRAPYRLLVVGDPQTLATALDIPGGVIEVLRQRGASGQVSQLPRVDVTALRVVSAPEYARPAEP